MTRLLSPRVLLALFVVAALGGAIVHAQRTSSSGAMATAAEKFLASLTPEQRQQIETKKQEMRQRMEQRRQQRELRRQEMQQRSTTDKPATK